jgi:uncharacterized repeat protein (TIGR03803 family)
MKFTTLLQTLLPFRAQLVAHTQRKACQALLLCATASMASHAQTLTTLVTFDVTNGAQPSGLKQATNGNFYGTTSSGGANGDGEVFEMTLTGGLTILHSFDVTDGIDPASGLAISGGNYYGTTAAGGADACGEVFEMTPTGTLTVLHSFIETDGKNPNGLRLGSDGNFYGTTQIGGADGDGEVYKVTTSGTVTVLHSFDISDGAMPKSGLVQGIDGNYYGTTSINGPDGDGTVFKITPSGTLTTLVSFNSTNGDGPGGLLQSTVDGNFYGTTQNGGADGDGVVYKMTPSGTLTVLHSFDVTDGAFPGSLIEGTDGNLYGTTKDGGADGDGEVYKLTLSGTLTILHSFDVTDGEAPGTLVQGFDGNFYGADVGDLCTKYCGPLTDGSIYKLTVTHTLPGPNGIATIAGDGTQGYSGDGGPAINAELQSPYVNLDSAGNMYITSNDLGDCRVRKVTASTGIISTVVGNGTCGFSGDGGPATSAEIEALDVAVDAAGDIFIVDDGNSRIRKVTASTGIISTVAGNGTRGYSGDGGPATSAELHGPTGIAVDSAGNLYIADEQNNRIRKVTASTGIISTVAGDGTEGFSGDGGPATSAELAFPISVALDSAGDIYLVDGLNERVRKVTASTGDISTVAGNGKAGYSGDGGPATSAELNAPTFLALDSAGDIYIADYSNYRIRKVTALTGIISTAAGDGSFGFSGDGEAATSAEISTPCNVATDVIGNIYIGDCANERVRVVGY